MDYVCQSEVLRTTTVLAPVLAELVNLPVTVNTRRRSGDATDCPVTSPRDPGDGSSQLPTVRLVRGSLICRHVDSITSACRLKGDHETTLTETAKIILPGQREDTSSLEI